MEERLSLILNCSAAYMASHLRSLCGVTGRHTLKTGKLGGYIDDISGAEVIWNFLYRGLVPGFNSSVL